MNAPNNDFVLDDILNNEDEEGYEENNYSELPSLWDATVEVLERELLQGRRPSNT